MRSRRGVVAIIVTVVWVLSAPLAMASNHCMAMGAMCEGPCGASSCAAVGQPEMAAPALIAPVLASSPAAAATTPPPLLDPPPRALLHFS